MLLAAALLATTFAAASADSTAKAVTPPLRFRDDSFKMCVFSCPASPLENEPPHTKAKSNSKSNTAGVASSL